MAYEYWSKIEAEEHYLFAKEIATIWRLKTNKGQPHYQLVGYILRKYSENNGITPLYYLTGLSGMCPVYSRSTYEGAYDWFMGIIEDRREGSIRGDTKNYNYVITPRSENPHAQSI